MHDEAPVSLYDPALHNVHEFLDHAEMRVEDVPAGHGVHAADAGEEAYVPGTQGIQETDPGGEDVPTIHG
jgi:hypothetical protein